MIELKNINCFYGDNKVLNNVSVDFPRGKLTIILGPNGCGKTTLIKTALGLVEKKSGDVFIEGKNIKDMGIKDIAKKVSYLSQCRNVPSILAEKMVLHGRFPYLSWPRHYSKKDWEIVNKTMKETGCDNLKGRLMTDLSGGERQKVYLAMAIAQNTETIFMDEPTTYLDPEHQLAVMNSGKLMCHDGKTVVMVIHDLSLALRNGDNIIVMNKGSVLAQGNSEEIFNSGILEEVFNVKVGRANCKDGCHYWAESKSNVFSHFETR